MTTTSTTIDSIAAELAAIASVAKMPVPARPLPPFAAGAATALRTPHPDVNSSLVAWLVDHTGEERYRLVVFDEERGEVVDDLATDASVNVVWETEDVLLVSKVDPTGRTSHVVRRRLGEVGEDVVVSVDDPAFYVYAEAAATGGGAVVTATAGDRCRVWFVPPGGDAQEVWPSNGCPSGDATVGVIRTGLIAHVHSGEAAGSVWSRPSVDPADAANWTSVPTPLGVSVTAVIVSASYVVVATVDGMARRLWRAPHADLGTWTEIVMPSTAVLTVNRRSRLDADELLLTGETMTSSAAAIRIDLQAPAVVDAGESTEIDDPPVVREIVATSADGATFPVTVATPPTGVGATGVAVLLVYGSYGESTQPAFRPEAVVLARHGVSFALAHVRGGGELGQAWREAGRGPGKAGAVDDVLAATDALVAAGIAREGGVVLWAHSAGAVLAGAALNRAPERFAGVVLDQPFVDVIGSLTDPTDRLAAHDRSEWGDPADPEVLAHLRRICPTTGVRAAPYPPMLIHVPANDTRTPSAAVRDFATRVRAMSTSAAEVDVRIVGGGHLSGRLAEARMIDAQRLAFVLDLAQRRSAMTP